MSTLERLTRAWPLACGLVLAGAGDFQAFDLPDVRAIYERPWVEGTRPAAGKISPDDAWVAYFWNEEGYARPLNLFLVPSGGGTPRKLTQFTSHVPESSKPISWPLSSPGAFVEFSPDSRKVLFGYDGDLYVAAVDGSGLERLTRTNAGESEAIWAPDGKSIVYTSGGALYRMSYPGPGIQQLTSPEGEASHSSPRWSPDGARIAFTSQVGSDQHDFLVPYYLDEWVRTKDFKRGLEKNRVGIVSPEGGPVVWVDTGDETIWWLNEVVWSRDGRRILLDYLSKDTKTRTIVAADAPPMPAAPKVEEVPAPPPSPPEKKQDPKVVAWRVYRETDPKWIYTFDGFVTDTTSTDFAPDGSRILFTSEKSGTNQVYTVGVLGGRARRVTQGKGAVDWAGWMGDSKTIVTLAADDDPARRFLFLTPAGGGKSERLEAVSTYLTHPVLSRRGGLVLYEGSRLGVPYDYFTASLATKSSVQVSRTVPEKFADFELPGPSAGTGGNAYRGWVLPEIVSFPARDGTRLRGALYGPRSVEGSFLKASACATLFPVVMFVHGAGIQQNVVEGWSVYSPNFKFATVLSQRGFAVFEVDYRGSTGYGRDFRTDVAGHLGGKDLDDELSAVDYLKTLPCVDSARIGIYGGSYGGFMAEMALFQHPDVFAAGAALRPVADWSNYYRSNAYYCLQRLGALEDQPEAYRRSSPINFAQSLQDPLLLLHGVLDSNVPFQDTVQLTDRLQYYQKPFELMIYPREDHTFAEPQSWIDQYSRILDFFVRQLNP
jgi:dipeptidyl aminopeptidase/acylaminoacyl peptidase